MFNPNAVFVSPSSIADFSKCPQLYYYRNVYRSPRGLKIQLINPSLALGQVVHDTLSQFLTLPPLSRDKDELLRIFEVIWEGVSGEKGGFASKSEEGEFIQRAKAMLDRFWGNKHFQETEMVKIPSFPKVELGNDIILTGKLDWIEKDEEGYHVIDFKTGKNEEREDSLQLPIYAVLASHILNTPMIRASYWYLDKDDKIVPFNLPDLKVTFADLQQRGAVIKMVRQTQSYRCQSGGESCWACRDILAVAKGKGKLVTVDPVNRKQEIYIMVKDEVKNEIETPDDLPF
ncbi:MAG: PD-(D/E)XK nuclease family protein [bacterium]|nr:PD-(D/E)XK nuclease family protein [bacterium]